MAREMNLGRSCFEALASDPVARASMNEDFMRERSPRTWRRQSREVGRRWRATFAGCLKGGCTPIRASIGRWLRWCGRSRDRVALHGVAPPEPAPRATPADFSPSRRRGREAQASDRRAGSTTETRWGRHSQREEVRHKVIGATRSATTPSHRSAVPTRRIGGRPARVTGSSRSTDLGG